MPSQPTYEELLQELQKVKSQIRYGLVWEDKPEKVVQDCQTNYPILKEMEDKAINTDNQKPVNLLIEGDNYHALQVLNYTHKGKVDVIYIDPPYNTGNKDFVYNDRYVDKEDQWRHSMWLSFMEKRLLLARQVLSEKGVIFISIDDNEQAQLKLLCDRVFGEINFINQIVWRKKYGVQNDAKFFSTSHEYVLCYAKNIDLVKINQLARTEKHDARYKNPDNDPRGNWKPADLSVGRVTEKDIYEITTPSGRKVLPPEGRSWVLSKVKFEECLTSNRIWFGNTGNNIPSVKKFLTEVQQGITATTFWDYTEVGHTDGSRKALKEIFAGQGVFDYPKPVDLLKRCISLFSQPNSIILDFMAGSGTTGQAVLELNKEDGGNRQFILVTNNELNGVGSKLVEEQRPNNISDKEFEEWKQQFGICRRVTYQRLNKVITGYTNSKEKVVQGLGGNLKYYRTAFVPKSISKDQVRTSLTAQCTNMLQVKEGIFELYKSGEEWQIFRQDNKSLGVFYEVTLFNLDDFVQELKNLNGEKSVYCFSFGSQLDRRPFEDVKDCKLEAIPEPILEIYNELNKLNK